MKGVIGVVDSSDVVMKARFYSLHQQARYLEVMSRSLLAEMEEFKEDYFKDEIRRPFKWTGSGEEGTSL